MYQVIGKKRKAGNYEGRDYDNTILYCIFPIDPDKGEGNEVITLKIKTERLNDEVSIGDKVTPYYDQFGNVVTLTIE